MEGTSLSALYTDAAAIDLSTPNSRWIAHVFTPTSQYGPPPRAQADIARWYSDRGLPVHTPFLLSPVGEYDLELNSFFRNIVMVVRAPRTQEAYARDLARFLTFLGRIAPNHTWKTVTEEHRRFYYHWRNLDERGPRVSASTWNREVASLTKFYAWALQQGFVQHSPMSMSVRHRARIGGGIAKQITSSSAELRPNSSADRIPWLPAPDYRRWRDIGLRGYSKDGLPDPHFRGVMAGRNAAFADIMIRTGMRLREQASLLLQEVPSRTGDVVYVPGDLSPAVTKNKSARRIYYPRSVLLSLETYVRSERAEAVHFAQGRRRYVADSTSFILNPETRTARRMGSSDQAIRLTSLTEAERMRTFWDGPDGLEPAALWLTEGGTPLSPRSWQAIFRKANSRCSDRGVTIACHPHMLRHSFAVITLEQLQRGHIQRLSEMDKDQRRNYRMVFGDPLDWVRLRLGHRSIETTQGYLHVLAELDYETRLSLTDDTTAHEIQTLAPSPEAVDI